MDDLKFFDLIKKTLTDFLHLTWGNLVLANLLPDTIGNIIGGAVMVGLVNWFAYLREALRKLREREARIVSSVAR